MASKRIQPILDALIKHRDIKVNCAPEDKAALKQGIIREKHRSAVFANKFKGAILYFEELPDGWKIKLQLAITSLGKDDL